MTTLEKLVQALRKSAASGADGETAARATIEALRPATPDMQIAGGIAGANAAGAAETWVDIADATWNAMIDRILKEDI